MTPKTALCPSLHLSHAFSPSVLSYFMRGRRVICGCYSLPHTSMERGVKGDTRSHWAHPAGHPHTPALLWKDCGRDVDRQTDGGERGEERKWSRVGKLFLNETSHAYQDILRGLGRVWRLCLETCHQKLAFKVSTSHLLHWAWRGRRGIEETRQSWKSLSIEFTLLKVKSKQT